MCQREVSIHCNTITKQNFSLKKLLTSQLFVILIFLMLLSIVGGITESNIKFFLNALLFGVTAFICLRLTGLINHDKRDFFDPGFLFIWFIILSLMPLVILTLLDVSITSKEWKILDIMIFSKVILAHVVLLLSFSFAYGIIFRKKDIDYGTDYHEIWFTKLWIWLALSLILFSFAISYCVSGKIGYLMFLLNGLKEIALIFAVGVILCRVSSLNKARILLFAIGAMFLFVPNILAAEKGIHFVSRGGAFVLALGAACYADRVRWKGKLLNWRWLIIVFLVALIGLGGANILEKIYLSGTMPSSEVMLKKIFLALSPRVIENAGTVIFWVDYENLPLQHGRNYIHALTNLIPFEKSHPGLAEWFAWKLNPAHAATGARYAFSAVGEGYLNYRMLGVMIHGIILGIIASLIRYLKFGRGMKIYGLFFYAVSLRIVFYLFRTDSFNILKKLEFIFLETAILLFIVSVLLPIGRFKRKEAK